MNYNHQSLSALTLGQQTQYSEHYDPTLLQSVPRSLNRNQLNVTTQLLFTAGADLWTAYELSWLNLKGVPQVAIAEVMLDFQSENLIESKSFKLYLNSFNQSKFVDFDEVRQVLEQDLAKCANGEVKVKLHPLPYFTGQKITMFEGICIDDQDIEITDYQFNPTLLENSTSDDRVEETLVSHLLKSNCLITQQPDWGSIQIHYVGKQIDREKLLRYLISFRQHNEFHEQCVERIFCDLMRFAQPEKLTVYARYTRRGGLDINPFRSNFEPLPENCRLARQ